MNVEPVSEKPRVLKAHGEWLYVEKIVELRTAGGLHIPQTFDHRNSVRRKFAAVQDTFRARVLSVGHRVTEPIEQFDEVVVYTFAEGDGSRLYTGENAGEKLRMFIKQKDVVCVIERERFSRSPSLPSAAGCSGVASSKDASVCSS